MGVRVSSRKMQSRIINFWIPVVSRGLSRTLEFLNDVIQYQRAITVVINYKRLVVGRRPFCPSRETRVQQLLSYQSWTKERNVITLLCHYCIR